MKETLFCYPICLLKYRTIMSKDFYRTFFMIKLHFMISKYHIYKIYHNLIDNMLNGI